MKNKDENKHKSIIITENHNHMIWSKKRNIPNLAFPEILDQLTVLGFDFDKSSLEAKTIAIEKYRQYEETIYKYFYEVGIDLLRIKESTEIPFEQRVNLLRETAFTQTLEYLKYYDTLLQEQWVLEKSKDDNFPIDAVKINMMHMICYGEELATNLHEQITAFLASYGLKDHSTDMCPEYMEKIRQGFTESEDNIEYSLSPDVYLK